MEPAADQAGDTTQKRKRSTMNLILRAVSAFVALAVMYLCLRWDVRHNSGWAWAGLIALFSIPCLWEFYRLAKDCEIYPFSWVGFVCGPLYILAQEFDLGGMGAKHIGFNAGWAVLTAACVLSMLLQLTRKTNENALVNVALTIWGLVYCAVLPGVSVHLRHLQLAPGGWPMQGVEFAIVCIFVAKVSDVGALLTGSRWGKHKMIPRLSPGKTWEGAAGGLLFSIFLLQFMVFTSGLFTNGEMALAGLGLPLLALLSFLLAAGGMAGDLIESAFKRNSRRKDAGGGVPGFGGVLDLMDSLMVATPVMYFFLLACGATYA